MTAPATGAIPVLLPIVPAAGACEGDACVLPFSGTAVVDGADVAD